MRAWRQVSRASSYLSQCDPRLHFGLGAATEVDGMMIHWPSGRTQKVAVEGIDRAIVVTEAAEQ